MTPHAATGVYPAYHLHGRRPRTRLDIVGLPSRRFFEDIAADLRKLSESSKQRQQQMKSYMHAKWSAQESKAKIVDYVKVKMSAPAKRFPVYSDPVKVVRRYSHDTFGLDDGRVWNGSRLTVVGQVYYAGVEEANRQRSGSTCQD